MHAVYSKKSQKGIAAREPLFATHANMFEVVSSELDSGANAKDSDNCDQVDFVW